MTENEVEYQIVSWLREQGYIVRRQHVGVYRTLDHRTVRIGDLGECDWRAFRSLRDGLACEYLEFEAKATGRKPAPKQREYMAKRKHQGIVCICADSLESFKQQLCSATIK